MRSYRAVSFAAAAVAVLLVAVPASCFALELPSAPDGPVTDDAGLLSSAAQSRVEAKILAHETESSDQVAVAIFKSLDGEVIEDASIRLAKLWKIGTDEHDNGVLLLVFVEDRRSRIEVGYGLEGRLTDAISSRILRETMAPRFRAGDFDGGIEASVDAILAVIRGEYVAPPAKNEFPLGILLFWIFVLVFLVAWWRGARAYSDATLRDAMDGRGSGWSRGRGLRRRTNWEDIFRGGGGFGGGGFGGGSGGGGFSGGGGSFGGGGSSGRW